MAKERAEGKEPREIKSSTYERAQKRLEKDVLRNMGVDNGGS